MKRSPLHRAGFTLLEIMLVVLIIGLLIGMAIKFTAGHLGQAQEVAVHGHIENYKTMLLMYQGSNGFLPTYRRIHRLAYRTMLRAWCYPKPRSASSVA